MSLRKELIERIAKWGVENQPLPGRKDGFSSLCYRDKAFAHFHNDNELDLRLTRRVIDREGLAHPPNSEVHPKRTKTSQWIEMRLETGEDLDRVMHFIRLTIENM